MSEKRQRQKENRAIRLAAERKAAQWKRRKRLVRNVVIVIVVVFGGAFLISLLGGDSEPDAATTTTTSTAGPTTTAGGDTTTTISIVDAVPTATNYELFASQETACGGTAPPPPATLSFDEAEDQGLASDAVVTAIIKTSCGDIILDLDPSRAPQTVNSFVFLARQGFFDGAPAHRLVPGFVIQMGDPTGTGTGGPGYRFDDELPPDGTSYNAGVLAMANSGPDTNGSQMFLTVGDSGLNTDFTVFGSFDPIQPVITDILAIPLGPNQGGEVSRPLQSIYIESVEITVG